MKTGFIHVLRPDGKHFLIYSNELVLTLMDDYGRKNCFDFTALTPSFLRGLYLLKTHQDLENYEK